MTILGILVTVLFFSIVPTSTSFSGEDPLKEDVEYDEVQANKNDFDSSNDKANSEDQDSQVLLAKN